MGSSKSLCTGGPGALASLPRRQLLEHLSFSVEAKKLTLAQCLLGSDFTSFTVDVYSSMQLDCVCNVMELPSNSRFRIISSPQGSSCYHFWSYPPSPGNCSSVFHLCDFHISRRSYNGKVWNPSF